SARISPREARRFCRTNRNRPSLSRSQRDSAKRTGSCSKSIFTKRTQEDSMFRELAVQKNPHRSKRRTSNDERRTSNDERTTTNDERTTTNEQRRTRPGLPPKYNALSGQEEDPMPPLLNRREVLV